MSNKKPKNKKAPKNTVVEDEKDKAIREMGEASRRLYGRTCATTQVDPSSLPQLGEEACISSKMVENPTCCTHVPIAVEEKTGDKDSDDILKKINAAISAGPAPVTVSVTSRASGKPGYYWQLWEGEQIPGGGPVFAITPKAYFDENGCLDDSHFEGETDDIPKGFSNLMESMFEYEGTREQAEAILRANPLFEEKGITPAEDESEEA